MIYTLTDQERDQARALISEVQAIDPYCMIRPAAVEGLLSVKPTKPLPDELWARLREHKDLLLMFVKTPPPLAGRCIRGHAINWYCTEYGLWVCVCYLYPPDLKHVTPAKDVRDYWTKERI
jgi:hypothetical protein